MSIKITFTGTWTEEDIEKVVRQVKAFWENMNVGDAFTFDAAESNQTNMPWATGVAAITIDSDATGRASATFVPAGEFLKAPGLTHDQKLQAVANAANHEIFAHQFRLGPHTRGDLLTYSHNRGGNVVPEVADRYGTITDSGAWRYPETRSAFVSGPLPVHASDQKQARDVLGKSDLKPPSQGPNRWWKFW